MSKWIWRSLHSALVFIWLIMPVGAVQPDEILADPALEARARAISAEVRCVVCQNEAIDTSNAGVARDLRILIRERLEAGDTDEQVKNYLVARYGDFVLFRPPLRFDTALLWFAPFLLFLGGLVVVVRLVCRQSRSANDREVALDDLEVAAFEQLEEQLKGKKQ